MTRALKLGLPPLTQPTFNLLRDFLEVQSGIVLSDNQKSLVEGRLQTELLKLGFNTWEEYVNVLLTSAAKEDLEHFVNLLTTNKTHFFREQKHFDYLRQEVLPNWTADAPMMFWSGACSRGHEVYSLAMLLEEQKMTKQADLNYRILGTDIDSEVLERAQKGIYPRSEVLKEVPEPLLHKYWLRGTGSNDSLYRWKLPATNDIKFRKFNLLQSLWPTSFQFDVILLRNVLIYFNSEAVDKIVERAVRSLKPNGHLIFGYSEGVSVDSPHLQYRGNSIYQKTDKPSRRLLPMKKRVAIVEDSKTIQKLLKKLFEDSGEFEVFGVFDNPLEAIERFKEDRPDVMTLDINMPKMTGVEYLAGPGKDFDIPVVMVTSHGLAEGGDAVEALNLGAFECIQKPSFNSLDEVSERILTVVSSAVGSKVVRSEMLFGQRESKSIEFSEERANTTVIAIGASTGGTTALQQILKDYTTPCPPILIVQHIPKQFSSAFSEFLDNEIELHVKEAEDGDIPRPNTVYIAPGGKQMKVSEKAGQIRIHVTEGERVSGHAPSVDHLFTSLVDVTEKKIVAALLTGMGSDGAKGLKALFDSGVETLIQDEATSVVFGMPRVALELGASRKVVPLPQISCELKKLAKASAHSRSKSPRD